MSDLPDTGTSSGSHRPDLRAVPLAVAAWAASWAATSGSTAPVLACAGAAAAVAGLAVRRRSAWQGATALALVTCLAIGALHTARITSGPVSDLGRSEAVVTLVLRTRTDPQVQRAAGRRQEYVLLRGRALIVSGRGSTWAVRSPVLVTASGWQVADWSRLPVGSTVRTEARLQPPHPGSDVSAVVRVRGPTEIVSPPSPGLRAVERVREGLRRSVAHRRVEQRALVPALVLGDTSGITSDITADFQTTGLTHLTAVSGANLTLLLAFLLMMARWVGVRGRWLRLVGLAGVLMFVALCRTEPSVLRAAAMGLVSLAALGAGGVAKGLRHLAVAMVVLLLADPFLSRSIGFALSVLASGGIVWWARHWAAVMVRWLPRIVAESVAVPLAAHLATLPVVAAISGQVSVVGVLTNAVAGPFVGPATVLGFAAALLSLVSAPAAALAAFGSCWSAQMILWVAHLGARTPGAAWPWPVTAAGVGVLAAGAITVGWLMPRLLRSRLLATLLAGAMAVGFLRPPGQPGWPGRDWVMVACAVGQGDGLAVRVGPGQAVVVDAGPDPDLMDRCLDQLGIDGVPVLVLTHFHADHVDGVRGVLQGRDVGAIWSSPIRSPATEAAIVRRLAAERAIPDRAPVVGERVVIGDAIFDILGPVGSRLPDPGVDAEEESAAENDASLVMKVTVGGVRLLLTGDVEPEGQQAILATGADLGADVLKLPHHGSGRQDPDFLAATGARVAIASAGLDNSYGHPAPRTVQLAASLGMTVLRTDLQGSVAVVARKSGLAAVAQR
ncbi:MAG TPA: ComEC/Rec2 family competence protein [Propionibacteriaceae bacterium]|nr:ComEC/Rec2 family competence protein [Propionibacteriaceae bacterium]